jgi:plastocyanin
MRKQALAATLAVFAAVAVAACGGGGEAPAPGGTATPAPGAAAAIDPASITDGATVNGSIAFAGDAPQAQVLQMAADPFCVSAHSGPVTAQRVVVNDNGTLRHVFVYVKEGLDQTFTVPTDAVEFSQEGCMYNPHVFGVRARQTLTIVNNDNTLHNVNAQPANNAGFNFAQPLEGMTNDQIFANPEIMIPVMCNVHAWMQAYIGVVAHPYFAVTGEDGSFTIANLPAGDYVIAAWHESMGEQTQNVSVAANETAEVSFSFGG